MPTPNKEALSSNQRAMLDLALLCDLQCANAEDRPTIRARHAQIKTRADALVYIRTVEHKIHARRTVTQLPARANGR